MSKGIQIRAYDYVNHPYEQVRDALRDHALAVFQSATKAAASRARSTASQLRVNIAGIEVATEVAISVTHVEESDQGGTSAPETRMQLVWEAAKAPRLFPFMWAEFAVYPLTATETQLDFSGMYEPPLGVVGSAMNALVGHRIAEASVHRFVTDVAEYLRTTLPQTAGG